MPTMCGSSNYAEDMQLIMYKIMHT